MQPAPRRFGRTVAALLLFGFAFGYLEAAVVCYLRDLHEPARQRFYPGRPPGEIFPLLTLDQIRQSGTLQSRTLEIELGRELATLVMLAAVGLSCSGRAGGWAAAFVTAFGVWDISFYCFLKLLLDWPATLLTWDILFLVPVPWTGPVLAPVLVSCAMIATGTHYLWRDSKGALVRLGILCWTGILAGAAAILTAFMMNYRQVMAAGSPGSFSWWIFGAGLAAGVASYAGAAARHRAGRAVPRTGVGICS